MSLPYYQIVPDKGVCGFKKWRRHSGRLSLIQVSGTPLSSLLQGEHYAHAKENA